MMKSKSIYRVLCAIILSVSFVIAPHINGSTPRTGFRSISIDDGLPSNSVGAIRRDSKGYLWIGTKNGLARFDGMDLKSYPETAFDDVWSIEEFGNDTLIYGTISDLKYFSRVHNSSGRIEFPATIIKALKRIDSHRILVGTENGLYILDDLKPHHLQIETGFTPSNHITGILHEGKDIYWFSTAGGLGRIDVGTMEIKLYRMPATLDNSNFFTCLTRYGDGIYLGSFNKGVFRFGLRDKTFSKVPGFDHNLIMTLGVQDNRLIVGTNGHGLKVRSLDREDSPITVHNDKQRNSIASNTVTCFLYDDGIPWVGTQFGGLSYVPRTADKFSAYSFNNFYSADHRVRSFYMFDNGNKLVGTRNGLYYIDERKALVKRFSSEDSSSGLRSDIIMHIDRIGDKVLIGTYGGGFNVFDPATATLSDLSREELTLYGCIFHFIPDNDGGMYVATQDGVYLMDRNRKIVRHYSSANTSLPTSAIFMLRLDSFGRLWIGSKFGLHLLDTQTGRMAYNIGGINNRNAVSYLMLDRKGDIWACTDAGLYRINKNLEQTAHYGKSDILPSDNVISIYEDADGFLWIAADRYITKYEPKSGKRSVFRKQDGLGDKDFNCEVLCYNDTTIWWAAEEGLFFADRFDDKRPRIHHDKVYITSCRVGDRTEDLAYSDHDGVVDIPSDADSFELRFSNLDFSSSHTNIYEYKLEGHDRKWQTLTGSNSIVYKDVKPGKYKFNVRIPGSGNVTSIEVKVHRSYAGLVLTTIAIAIVLSIITVFVNRLRKMRQRMHHEREVLSRYSKKSIMTPNPGLTKEKNNLMDLLTEWMQSSKPYLNSKLAIHEAASALNTSDTELSQLLNVNFGINWTNFVNTYRINEFKSMLTSNNLSRYTLRALSEKCGFTSKTTFYRVFKQTTGMTPREYCRQNGISLPMDE